MRRMLRVWGALLLAGAMGSVPAKMLPDRALAPLLPQAVGLGAYDGATRRDASGQLLSWYAVDEVVHGDSPEVRARDFLRRHAAALNISSPDSLEHLGTRSGPAGDNVHFEQRVRGLRVYGSRTVVHISPDARVTHLSHRHVPGVHTLPGAPLIDAAAAAALARELLQAVAPRFEEQELMLYQDAAGTTRLVWRVALVATQPVGDWELLIDALGGELLARWDRAAYATGSAFLPDPLGSSHTLYGQPIVDQDDADYPEIAAEVFTVDLGSLDNSGGLFRLQNQWAQLGDFEAPATGLFVQGSPDYLFSRDADGFEASNTFFHLQLSMRHVNETLGLGILPYQYEHGVLFDPHGLNGDDNSHYVPSTGELGFGEGCVDDAEDADVIWHELAHGLHDWVTLGGLSNNIDGLSEGFGDYWAQSYSRSLGQWQPDEEPYDWVFSWDGHNECWAGRVTNYALPWPLGIQPFPFIHTSGQIWATCLMGIYDQIGRNKTDAMVLEGLAMTNAVSTQNDAANAAYQAAADMGYDSSELDFIAGHFASCGYILPAAVSPLAPAGPRAPGLLSRSAETIRGGGAAGSVVLALLLLAGGFRAAGRARRRRSAGPSSG